jgi:hypothetical protein
VVFIRLLAKLALIRVFHVVLIDDFSTFDIAVCQWQEVIGMVHYDVSRVGKCEQNSITKLVLIERTPL